MKISGQKVENYVQIAIIFKLFISACAKSSPYPFPVDVGCRPYSAFLKNYKKKKIGYSVEQISYPKGVFHVFFFREISKDLTQENEIIEDHLVYPLCPCFYLRVRTEIN
jgi:hypothetical protein